MDIWYEPERVQLKIGKKIITKYGYIWLNHIKDKKEVNDTKEVNDSNRVKEV